MYVYLEYYYELKKLLQILQILLQIFILYRIVDSEDQLEK